MVNVLSYQVTPPGVSSRFAPFDRVFLHLPLSYLDGGCTLVRQNARGGLFLSERKFRSAERAA